MEDLIADGAGLVVSTSFDHDPFLLAMAKKYPNVMFRQASALASSSTPPNVGSQNALINQGHYVNGVAAGLCTRTNKLGFVAGMPLSAPYCSTSIPFFSAAARQITMRPSGSSSPAVGRMRLTTPRRRMNSWTRAAM